MHVYEYACKIVTCIEIPFNLIPHGISYFSFFTSPPPGPKHLSYVGSPVA